MRPTSVIQELLSAAALVTALATVLVILGGGLVAILLPHGLALGLWLAAGWMWLRGVGE